MSRPAAAGTPTPRPAERPTATTAPPTMSVRTSKGSVSVKRSPKSAPYPIQQNN